MRASLGLTMSKYRCDGGVFVKPLVDCPQIQALFRKLLYCLEIPFIVVIFQHCVDEKQ